MPTRTGTEVWQCRVDDDRGIARVCNRLNVATDTRCSSVKVVMSSKSFDAGESISKLLVRQEIGFSNLNMSAVILPGIIQC